MDNVTSHSINNTVPVYAVGINREFINKTGQTQLSHEGAWQRSRLSMQGLADHIRAGYPWMPALIDNRQRRKQEYCNYAAVLSIDVDNGRKVKGEKAYRYEMHIEDALAHPFITRHCGLAIESANSAEGWPRFRLVFPLAQPIEGYEAIKLANTYLAYRVGVGDPSAKDASRFYYGATDRKPFLLNAQATLPDDFLDAAQRWQQQNQAVAGEQKQYTQFKRNNPDTDEVDLVLSALDRIPSDAIEYQQWISIGMTLYALNIDYLVWESWSLTTQGCTVSECQAKWKSFQGSTANIGLIVNLAKQYGWQYPTSKCVEKRPVLPGVVNSNTHSNPVSTSDSEEVCWCVATDKDISTFTEAQTLSIDFDLSLLPPTLASDMKRDGEVFNVDPVMFWQYVLPATGSLMGESWLDMSGFRSPNINWTLTVLESGGGKTRAKQIAISPLTSWQAEANQQWEEEKREYRKAARRNDEDLERPTLRKFTLNVATPQAVIRRMADQPGYGCVWARDEIAGLFKSLNQFTNEGEGLEVLMESWDGGSVEVDRVDESNSYFVPPMRLNIAGGLQPGIASELFPRLDDPQGLLARFLPALPKILPVVRVKGRSALADSLPFLYQWVQSIHWGVVMPTGEADDFYTYVVESFGNATAPHPAIKSWLNKAAGHTARIAFILHAIECYYDQTKARHTLTLDTLQRAYKIACYYRNCVYRLHNQVMGNGISSLLSKVQEKSEREGTLALADIYRNSTAIRNAAKTEGKEIAPFTLGLIRELEALGLGTVKNSAKSFTYTAKKQHTNTLPGTNSITPTLSADITPNTHPTQFNTPNTVQHTSPVEEEDQTTTYRHTSTPTKVMGASVNTVEVGDRVTLRGKRGYAGEVVSVDRDSQTVEVRLDLERVTNHYKMSDLKLVTRGSA